MSLNHQLPNEDEYAQVSRETSWATWCARHLHHWNAGFFGSLTYLAAAATGATVGDAGLAGFAADHVVFTELCPYASDSFPRDPQVVLALTESDPASETAARIRTILLDRAGPNLVLINGWPAMQAFAVGHKECFVWRPWEVYESCDLPKEGRPRKRRWHGEGIYAGRSGRIAVVGFPFLRKPAIHNSNAEVGQLAVRIRAFKATVTTRRFHSSE